MARIRTIKPEFPQSETIGSLSRDARLLFIQLWTIADDDGRARASSRMLASLLYPYDDDARELMDGWLEELEELECIRRYTVDGSSYLEIVTWLKHQKIDKPSKSRLPEFVEGSRTVAKPREESATDLVPSTLDLVPRPRTISRAVAKATRSETNSDFEEFWKAYPRRLGANPKAPAFREFEKATKQGADPRAVVAGAVRCAASDRDKIGTPYIPQAVKWLRDHRWEDYQPPATAGPIEPPPGAPSDDELRKKYGQHNPVHTEAEAASGNGIGADHGPELRREGTVIRPAIRPF